MCLRSPLIGVWAAWITFFLVVVIAEPQAVDHVAEVFFGGVGKLQA